MLFSLLSFVAALRNAGRIGVAAPSLPSIPAWLGSTGSISLLFGLLFPCVPVCVGPPGAPPIHLHSAAGAVPALCSMGTSLVPTRGQPCVALCRAWCHHAVSMLSVLKMRSVGCFSRTQHQSLVLGAQQALPAARCSLAELSPFSFCFRRTVLKRIALWSEQVV